MLRPASPLLAQRLSPVNSITFISRDQSRIDNEDSDAYQPTPRPLSTMYCERMELTLSDISFGTDNSYSCNEPFRSVDLANKNRGYEPAFVTEAIQDPSPNFIESEPSGINNALSQNEGRTAVWDEKADCQVDSFLENQSKNSQASGATEESLFAGEKQNEQVPNAERYNRCCVVHYSDLSSRRDGNLPVAKHHSPLLIFVNNLLSVFSCDRLRALAALLEINIYLFLCLFVFNQLSGEHKFVKICRSVCNLPPFIVP